MSISLNHHLIRQKAEALDSADHRRHQEAVARAKSVDAALHAFDHRGPSQVTATKSSNGVGQLLAGAYPEPPKAPQTTPRKKVDKASIHPDVLAKTSNLSLNDNALALFDMVYRADLAAGQSGLIDLSLLEIQRVLGISEADAQAARAELLFHDLIVFQDTGSDKGYRPRMKSHRW